MSSMWWWLKNLYLQPRDPSSFRSDYPNAFCKLTWMLHRWLQIQEQIWIFHFSSPDLFLPLPCSLSTLMVPSFTGCQTGINFHFCLPHPPHPNCKSWLSLLILESIHFSTMLPCSRPSSSLSLMNERLSALTSLTLGLASDSSHALESHHSILLYKRHQWHLIALTIRSKYLGMSFKAHCWLAVACL